MNVLVIEDERPLGLALNRILTHAGWHVSWANDGQAGLDAAISGEYDAIVLDVLMPKKNGWEVCSELRAAKVNTPILMLSAMDEPDDKVRGLELGADDYMAKPFETNELVARVRALIRRQFTNRGQIVRVDDLEIDRRERKVARAGREIALTSHEYDLLESLAINEGKVISRESLMEIILSSGDMLVSTVETFIASLKAKIDAPFGSALIQGGVGTGYVLRSGVR